MIANFLMLEPLVLVSNESGIAILSVYNRECNGGSKKQRHRLIAAMVLH
jgi:hypothetical protein